MRAPIEWLARYCDPGLPLRDLAERLTLTGTNVERILGHGVGDTDAFIVGRVLDAQPHPDADRLTVCRVSVGEGDVAGIVCGAPNVATGQTVAVARPGAVMPDGTTLRAAKLRGVVSEGMILAEDELGIGTDHAGIIVLPDELVPGTPLADVLPISTDVLELEVTPNRPDCLGIYGVAREVHAATGAALAEPPWAEDPGSSGDVDSVRVTVAAPDLCPRFTARLFEDVTIGPSPAWLKARLMAAGQRPISNVVDITNYVMLLTGQPLHAFDADRIVGDHLIVRRADEGEELETLDGVVRRLDPEAVLVCDEAGPSGIGGIMGGARSEVADGTTRVLLEAATWVGANIQRTSTRLGLRTEASSRFEKGLAPEAALEAQTVASTLMVELCGARIAPGTIDVGGPGPEAARISLRPERVAGLLGMEVEPARCAEILRSLGFAIEQGEDTLVAQVPPFRRSDVTREVDLIEEVARIHGLEHLPSTLPSRRGATGLLTHAQRVRRRVEDVLVGRGLSEVAGWSFASPAVTAALGRSADGAGEPAVALENPMSEEDSLLRTQVLGSLLAAAGRNVARGASDLALFEAGAVYLPDGDGDGLPHQPQHVGALVAGRAAPPSWRSPDPPAADFYAIKALVAAVLDTLRVEWSVSPAAEPFLHPARAAEVLIAGAPAGWVGELHPIVTAQWDLRNGAAFELDLEALAAAAPSATAYVDVIGFPAVRQDLAVVVSDDVAAQRVLDVVRAAATTLEHVEVFDVYRGDQLESGQVSLALHCEFRAPDRTLTDEEVAAERELITTALHRELGATLRG